MKKILTSIAITSILATNLFSETIQENEKIDELHQVFINKTRNIDLTNSNKEFIYFGTLKDLQKEYKEIQKQIAEKGFDGAIKGLQNSSSAIAKGFLKSAGQSLGMGVGIGILYGALDPYIMSLYEDEQYILIYDFSNQNGEKTRISALFVASDFNNEETIKQYLENKINEGI